MYILFSRQHAITSTFDARVGLMVVDTLLHLLLPFLDVAVGELQKEWPYSNDDFHAHGLRIFIHPFMPSAFFHSHKHAHTLK